MPVKLPLTKLPAKTDFTLSLIREELKSRKLFLTLEKAGVVDCYLQPHLDLLILKSLDLYDGTDETFRKFDSILEKRTKKIKADNESIMKQTMKVYCELTMMKKPA